MTTNRRELLVAGLGTALVACGHAAAGSRREEKEGEEEGEVTPAEDLMREHGVLRRVIFVFEECSRRLQAKEELPKDVLGNAAGIVRTFVQDYHEQLEEQYLFPRFEAAKQQVELVATLRVQHKAGRALIDRIRSGEGAVDAIEKFRRMYEPHAAREDTVLFPLLTKVLGEKTYKELGEQFEDEEHKRFGARGFEGVVDEVAGLEANLGIADLAKFTPTA